MERRKIIAISYIVASAGIGLSAIAYENASVLYGKSECIVHIVVWLMVICMMLIQDVAAHEYKIESLLLIGLCIALNILSWNEEEIPYYLGKLKVSAIIVALLAAGIYFAVINIPKNTSVCIFITIVIGLYGASVFPAERVLSNTMIIDMYLSEIVLLMEVLCRSELIDKGAADCLRCIRNLPKKYERKNLYHIAQTICLFNFVLLMMLENIFFGIKMPKVLLSVLIIIVFIMPFLSKRKGLEANRYMICIAIITKAALDYSRDLVPAEPNYKSLYLLLSLCMLLSLVLDSKGKEVFVSFVVLTVRGLALIEYCCDLYGRTNSSGLIMMWSEILFSAAISLCICNKEKYVKGGLKNE